MAAVGPGCKDFICWALRHVGNYTDGADPALAEDLVPLIETRLGGKGTLECWLDDKPAGWSSMLRAHQCRLDWLDDLIEEFSEPERG